MDPNARLATILDLVNSVNEAESSDDMEQYAVELSQGVTDMHEWLSKGGFLPDAWDSKKGLAQLLQPIDTQRGTNWVIQSDSQPQCGTPILDQLLKDEGFLEN